VFFFSLPYRFLSLCHTQRAPSDRPILFLSGNPFLFDFRLKRFFFFPFLSAQRVFFCVIVSPLLCKGQFFSLSLPLSLIPFCLLTGRNLPWESSRHTQVLYTAVSRGVPSSPASFRLHENSLDPFIAGKISSPPFVNSLWNTPLPYRYDVVFFSKNTSREI